jgi:hypothetical protein
VAGHKQEDLTPNKPQSFAEFKTLLDNGDIEILLSEDMAGELTRLLILDHRRTYSEGEIYEILI